MTKAVRAASDLPLQVCCMRQHRATAERPGSAARDGDGEEGAAEERGKEDKRWHERRERSKGRERGGRGCKVKGSERGKFEWKRGERREGWMETKDRGKFGKERKSLERKEKVNLYSDDEYL